MKTGGTCRGSSRVAITLLGAAAALGLVTGPDASARRARPRPPDDPVVQNAACAGCHVDEAREWRGDQHHTAFTDGAFTRAFAREPLPYCQECHAPESMRGRDATELGVACTSCHSPASAGNATSTILIPAAGHPPLRQRDRSPAGACAPCHQFPFPPGAHQPAGWMQRTVDEHAASPFAAVPCAECHKPRVTTGGRARRSHTFLGGHSPDLVRSAISVQASRSGSRLDVTLVAGRVGHSVPTGDLFRRITLVAEALGADELVVTDATVVLARHFERRTAPGGIAAKVEVRDDRLKSGERRTVPLDLGPAAARLPIRYLVTYERLEVPGETVVRQDGAAVAGPRARVEGSVEIARGELAPAPRAEGRSRSRCATGPCP